MTSASRNAALLPGRTAGEWSALSRSLSIGILPFLLVVIAFRSDPEILRVTVVLIVAILSLLTLVAAVVIAIISVVKSRRELAAGYSTFRDVAGKDLRHPKTGAVIRPRTAPVAQDPARLLYQAPLKSWLKVYGKD